MALQGTSYADWLRQNDAAMMQAAGQQPPPVATAPSSPAPVAGTSSAMVATPPPTQAQPAEAAKGPEIWQQIGSLAGGGGGPQQPTQLRSSAYSAGVASDPPQRNAAPQMRGRAGKIAEIIGAVMSMGATKAVGQAQQNAQPDAVRTGGS